MNRIICIQPTKEYLFLHKNVFLFSSRISFKKSVFILFKSLSYYSIIPLTIKQTNIQKGLMEASVKIDV
jgi:hypothetical protein